MATSPREEESNGAQSKPKRKLPDPAICRAKRAGFGDYVDCLVDRPFECRFSLSFGGGHFCMHPTREDILARTKHPEGGGSPREEQTPGG